MNYDTEKKGQIANGGTTQAREESTQEGWLELTEGADRLQIGGQIVWLQDLEQTDGNR